MCVSVSVCCVNSCGPQEKEIHRLPVRETLKSMLAMGWNIDRTKDGETMSLRESEKMRKISQSSSQVLSLMAHSS